MRSPKPSRRSSPRRASPLPARTRAGDGAGFLLPARRVRPASQVLRHRRMFAQIGANRFVQRRNPGLRPNYFQAVAGVLRARAHAAPELADCLATFALPRASSKKTLEKSSLLQRRFACGRIVASRRGLHRRASGPIARGSDPPRVENNSAKVLTLEKTVIRFRPADVTCGRE